MTQLEGFHRSQRPRRSGIVRNEAEFAIKDKDKGGKEKKKRGKQFLKRKKTREFIDKRDMIVGRARARKLRFDAPSPAHPFFICGCHRQTSSHRGFGYYSPGKRCIIDRSGSCRSQQRTTFLSAIALMSNLLPVGCPSLDNLHKLKGLICVARHNDASLHHIP